MKTIKELWEEAKKVNIPQEERLTETQRLRWQFESLIDLIDKEKKK